MNKEDVSIVKLATLAYVEQRVFDLQNLVDHHTPSLEDYVKETGLGYALVYNRSASGSLYPARIFTEAVKHYKIVKWHPGRVPEVVFTLMASDDIILNRQSKECHETTSGLQRFYTSAKHICV